jgi:hypothetical protein
VKIYGELAYLGGAWRFTPASRLDPFAPDYRDAVIVPKELATAAGYEMGFDFLELPAAVAAGLGIVPGGRAVSAFYA